MGNVFVAITALVVLAGAATAFYIYYKYFLDPCRNVYTVKNVTISINERGTEIIVSWNAPSEQNALYEGFYIYEGNEPNFKINNNTKRTKIMKGASNRYNEIISNVVPGIEYYFKVSSFAFNENTECISIPVESVPRFVTNHCISGTEPLPPTDFSVTQTNGVAKFTWKPSAKATGYRLYGGPTSLFNVNKNSISYKDTSDVTYTYKIPLGQFFYTKITAYQKVKTTICESSAVPNEGLLVINQSPYCPLPVPIPQNVKNERINRNIYKISWDTLPVFPLTWSINIKLAKNQNDFLQLSTPSPSRSVKLYNVADVATDKNSIQINLRGNNPLIPAGVYFIAVFGLYKDQGPDCYSPPAFPSNATVTKIGND